MALITIDFIFSSGDVQLTSLANNCCTEFPLSRTINDAFVCIKREHICGKNSFQELKRFSGNHTMHTEKCVVDSLAPQLTTTNIS